MAVRNGFCFRQQSLTDASPAQFRVHPQHMHLQPAGTDVGQHAAAQRAVLVMPGQADWGLIERIAAVGLVEGQQARAQRARFIGAGSRHGADGSDHASRLPRRITRCFSIAQSRSLAASRLSWVCLPLASATSSLILFLLQYIAVGTIV